MAKFGSIIGEIALREGVRTPQISFNCAASLALALSENSARLILEELVENSTKFHPTHHPLISISVSPASASSVTIAIQDDGRHLSQEHLRRLHLPFYQAEDRLTGELQGEGLGLAQVARVVWEHGGSLRFSNRTDGPGLCVTMRVPLRQEIISG